MDGLKRRNTQTHIPERPHQQQRTDEHFPIPCWSFDAAASHRYVDEAY